MILSISLYRLDLPLDIFGDNVEIEKAKLNKRRFWGEKHEVMGQQEEFTSLR